jgi:hypothetical protein
VIVGAKDSCPFCAQKVSLKAIVGSSPWDPQSAAFVNILDAVRYLIVWYPALMMLMQLLIAMGHLGDITADSSSSGVGSA